MARIDLGTSTTLTVSPGEDGEPTEIEVDRATRELKFTEASADLELRWSHIERNPVTVPTSGGTVVIPSWLGFGLRGAKFVLSGPQSSTCVVEPR
jgi:hypothetical protein